MRTKPIQPNELRGVFAVPPLARHEKAGRSIDFEENDKIVHHIAEGGITRFLYGGNAFLYHVTLSDYDALVEWMAARDDALWMIPSIGPAFGRAIDQAAVLRRHDFPCVMALPCGDPRSTAGLERGLREISEAAATRLLLYLKGEDNFGPDKEAGLDAVGRLVDEEVCVGIKYAVVREDPGQDTYLEALLDRVDRELVISGIGERPAVIHMRDWELPGFTTGSGCIQPHLSRALFEAGTVGDFRRAEEIRSVFMPLEDLRDAWNPALVLHHATALAGIAETGPVPPFLAPLSTEQEEELAPVARTLVEQHRREEVLGG